MTEATIERLVCFVAGCCLGYVLHIIVAMLRETKQEVDELLDLERKKDELGFLQHRIAFNVVFSLMIVFVFYAAYSSFHTDRALKVAQEENITSLCKAGENGRDVQRKIVEAIYQLAIGAIQEDPDRPFTKKEIRQVNTYIDRTNQFRKSVYKQIKPPRTCMEYVDDGNVKPPTPPQEHLN